jgi:RNA polymerase sigma-70 factor (ECF subfamily)
MASLVPVREHQVRTSDPRGERWFTVLYAAHHGDLVRYGYRRLAHLDEASELAQEVFVVAWRRRADVPDHALPWLYGVARRLLANHWRDRRTRPILETVDLTGLAASGLAGPDTVTALTDLRAALTRLSAADREVLRLAAWEQLSAAEMATVLGCTRTAAKVRLHRARRRLAAALGRPDRSRNQAR